MAGTTEDLTAKLLTCLASSEVSNTLQALLKPIITKAVEDAVASVTADKTAEIELLKCELSKANRQINDLEQYSRRCCLDISGVPERQDEDTTELVVELSRVVRSRWRSQTLISLTEWEGPLLERLAKLS